MAAVEQFLTAMFELRPSRRKAAILERVRSIAEDVFWSTLETHREIAEQAVSASREDRSKAIRLIETAALVNATAAGLTEPVAQGVTRDISGAAASYIGLKAKGNPAEWPTRTKFQGHDFERALAAFSSVTTAEEYDAARDELNRVVKGPMARPFTLARLRDAMIIREKANSPLIAVLNVMKATDKASKQIEIKAGFNAATGEIIAKQKSKTRLAIPLSCSKWHENKFLSGKAELKSSQIIRKGERWFMAAQFVFKREKIEPRVCLGIDRGMVNLVSAAAVDFAGTVKAVMPISGNTIAERIRTAEQRAKRYQRRTARTIPLHHRTAHHLLHDVTNSIIAEAKSRQAQIIIEKLDGLKSAIRTKREKGARKNTWQKHLKKAQLAKVEQMLDYKTILAGLPKPRDVVAGGTSQTCSACGHREPKNRLTQEQFSCLECGFSADADMNAAVQIARRGTMKLTKGVKLDALHKNMVTKLTLRDDGGLGPLAVGIAKGFVAARVSGSGANARLDLPTSGSEQNITQDDENAGNSVFAERIVANSWTKKEEFSQSNEQLVRKRLR